MTGETGKLVALGSVARSAARRPLGPTLALLRELWGVNHGLESTSRRMKQALAVTGPERMVIRLVGRYPGVSAGELATLLRVHPSSLTSLLRRLSQRGLVVRSVDANDARRALFALTERGREIDAVQRGTVEAAVRTALASIAEKDLRATTRVLRALADALER